MTRLFDSLAWLRALIAVILIGLTALPVSAQPLGVLASDGPLVVEPLGLRWCGAYVRLRIYDRTGAPVVADSNATRRVITAARFAVHDYCPRAQVIEVYARYGDRFTRIWRAGRSSNWAWRLTVPTQVADARERQDWRRTLQGLGDQMKQRDSSKRQQPTNPSPGSNPAPSPVVGPPPASAPTVAPSQPQPSGGGGFDSTDTVLIVAMLVLFVLIMRATGGWKIFWEILYEIAKAIFSDRHRA